MIPWVTQLLSLVDQGSQVVVVTVASVKGSTPREPGAKMLVTDKQTYGTIGGGNLEHRATAIARQQLQSQPRHSLQRFPLGASLGQCCGGLVNLLFEPVHPSNDWLKLLSGPSFGHCDYIMITPTNGLASANKMIVSASEIHGNLGDTSLDRRAIRVARQQLSEKQPAMLRALPTVLEESSHAQALYFFEPLRNCGFNIVIFGAGHIGRALINILQPLVCNITWVDNRENQFPSDTTANVNCIISDCPEAEVDSAAANSFFLVMTQDHSLDQTICESILKKADYAYFGLIGSLPKRRRFEKRLSQRGFDADQVARLQCPVGTGQIKSKQPAAIAVSIAAEILEVYEQILASDSERQKSQDTTQSTHLRLAEERL